VKEKWISSHGLRLPGFVFCAPGADFIELGHHISPEVVLGWPLAVGPVQLVPGQA
jgi:hypothetical protein